MLLTNLLKNVFSKEGVPLASEPPPEPVSCVLNVGGNSKAIPIPAHYNGWRHALLDIAPGPDVDWVCDARALSGFDGTQFDAIYCSHNLEHFHPHDVKKVLAGFLHVLRPDGFAEIRVPDMSAVLKTVVAQGLELDEVLYVSPGGPISAHDVIYGWGKQIEESGVDFFAHKRGFTQRSLTAAVEQAGFRTVLVLDTAVPFELHVLAFKGEPSAAQLAGLGLTVASPSTSAEVS